MISGMGLGGTGGNPLVEAAKAGADPILRGQIALFEVRAKAFNAMSEKFIDDLKAGKAHPAQPSMMKYYGTELNKSRTDDGGGRVGRAGMGERAFERGRRAEGVAVHQGQFDRRRNQRSAAQHHFEADFGIAELVER